jgi:hypothetical protein
MTRLEALRDLRSAVQDGTAIGDHPHIVPKMNADLIKAALQDDDEHWSNFVGAFDGSVDDAIAVFKAMLPVNEWTLWMSANGEYACRIYTTMPKGMPKALVYAPTPARAMLLAVLDAMIEKDDGDG